MASRYCSYLHKPKKCHKACTLQILRYLVTVGFSRSRRPVASSSEEPEGWPPSRQPSWLQSIWELVESHPSVAKVSEEDSYPDSTHAIWTSINCLEAVYLYGTGATDVGCRPDLCQSVILWYLEMVCVAFDACKLDANTSMLEHRPSRHSGCTTIRVTWCILNPGTNTTDSHTNIVRDTTTWSLKYAQLSMSMMPTIRRADLITCTLRICDT